MIRLSLLAAALMLTHTVAWGQRSELIPKMTFPGMDFGPSCPKGWKPVEGTAACAGDDNVYPPTINLNEARQICARHTTTWGFSGAGGPYEPNFVDLCGKVGETDRRSRDESDLAALKTFVEQNK
jgi:hypothetical protein